MRKLATAAAVGLALASGGAFGLGLGDIEMRSALNQPMNAEIRLSSVKAGELDGMIVQLASPEAFQRAGIERSQALIDLRFSVDDSGAVPVIRITSARPVVEPFLNFLLEVDWPAGRMVREYTVLLDPPVFMTPSASTRDASGDTPARIGGDVALIAPAPIERGTNASVTDSFEVELVGDTAETADEAGEIVSLGGLGASPGARFTEPLGEVVLVDEGGAGEGGAGEIVSLTDLAAPNTDAAARRAAAAADIDFDVELVGDATEVADDVVADDRGRLVSGDATASLAPSTTGGGDGDGEIVSLEELDPSAIGGLGAGADAAADTLASGGSPGGGVTVRQGDTLFGIAADRASSEVSVEQMMLALLAANDSAFIDGNINLMRAGSVLRVPPPDEAQRLTQARAVAEVGRQNGLWQDYRDNLRGTQTTRVASADTPASSAGDAAGGTNDGASGDANDTAGDDVRQSAASERARAILEEARAEILNRDELRIVAAEESAEAATVAGNAAGAVADADPAARAGAIDRRLQLAREELASTRLESEELGEQAVELGGTAENLDALITLRQDEVAKLEARLAEARRGGVSADGDVADAANVADATIVADATDAADAPADASTGASAQAGDAAGQGSAAAGNAIADAAGNAADGVADAAATAGEAVGEGAAAARNALTDAGQELGDVSLVGAGNETDIEAAVADGVVTLDTDPAAGDADGAAAAVAAADRPWYQALLADPARLAIAGVGGAALLGVLGTLLWRRRRTDAADGHDEGDVEFLDEAGAAAFHAESGHDDGASRTEGAGVAGVAGAAAAAGAASLAAGRGDSDDGLSDDERNAFDDGALDETQVFSGGASLSGKHAGADLDADDDLDKDDTVSEADVYLAYGLHGQAEELLGRAVEREPENPVYARKLLDTYHAQGNADAFHGAAEDYRDRFGGDGAPDWAGVAAQGRDLRPGDALYGAAAVGAAAAVIAVPTSPASDDDAAGARGLDADGPVAIGTGGVDRGLGDDRDDAMTGTDLSGFDDFDETELADQSLDPAFAFDESDLEATGDFSSIADEVAAETREDVVEYSGFETDVPSAPRERPAAADAMDSLDAPELSGGLSGDFGDGLDGDLADLDGLDLATGATAANDKMPGDRAQGLGDGQLADDLTLDLDELSGELELDGTELLDGAVDDFEMPDLTAGNEPLLDGTAGSDGDGLGDITSGFGPGDADEMDTMMDLAKAYIDMGDKDSASSALDEIVRSGTPDQVVEAETLLKKIS